MRSGAQLDVFEQQQLVENAAQVGEYLLERLRELCNDSNTANGTKIKEVRGRGLMIGIELDEPQAPIRQRLLHEQHVFTGASGDFTLRLLPPLTHTKEQADEFVERFKQVLGV